MSKTSQTPLKTSIIVFLRVSFLAYENRNEHREQLLKRSTKAQIEQLATEEAHLARFIDFAAIPHGASAKHLRAQARSIPTLEQEQ